MRHTYRGSKLVVAACVLVASTAIAETAQAQTTSPIAFGITAGASKATGDLDNGVKLGYHFGGLVQWKGPELPFGIRGDAVYHRFSVRDVDANLNIFAGTVNGVWMFPMDAGASMSPYLIGGVGFYHLSASCSDCSGLPTSNKFGLNGGGGLNFALSGFNTFVEARYHHIFTDGGSSSMIPISVGIMFH